MSSVIRYGSRLNKGKGRIVPYSKDIVFLDKSTTDRYDFNVSKKFKKYAKIEDLLKDPNYFREYKFRVNGKRRTSCEVDETEEFIKKYKLVCEKGIVTDPRALDKMFIAGFSIQPSSDCKQIAPVFINSAIPIFLISSKEAECDWIELKYNSENQIETLKFGCTKPSDYKDNECRRKFCKDGFAPGDDLKALIDAITREIASVEILPLMNLSSFFETLIWQHVFFPKILDQLGRKTKERHTCFAYYGP